VDGKFSGGTLSDPSLTINNFAKSDEGIYMCRATARFGTISSEDKNLETCSRIWKRFRILTFSELLRKK
jgi:hypothetical protein